MTWQPSRLSTVTGTWKPASSKKRAIPSFLAMTPVRLGPNPLELELDVHAGGQVELHQRVHGLRGGIDDIEHALVRADFELLARLLVDVRRTVDGELIDARRQRDRPAHGGARSLGRVHDLAGGMVQHAVIEGFEPDADVLTIHIALTFPYQTGSVRVISHISKTSPNAPPPRGRDARTRKSAQTT